MTVRENLEKALHGEEVAQIPFAIYGGFFNVPGGEKLREVPSIGEISAAAPFVVEHSSVEVVTEPLPDGGGLTTYRTPLGELQQRHAIDPGYGSGWIVEHLVKRPEDWRIVRYIIEDVTYQPAPELWQQADERIGEQGMVMAPVERMPFQRLWIEFGDIEQLCIALADDRETMDRLISAMTQKARDCWEIVAQSEAEFIWAPDNVTSDILSPKLFRRYAQPYYEALAEVMHAAGKQIIAHMDGHLAALRDLIAATPIDVVESFTPPPNGNLSLAEAWAAWPDKKLFVNFPPAEQLRDPEEIKQRVKELVAELPQRRRFAFEISEDIPVDVAATNIAAIAEALEET